MRAGVDDRSLRGPLGSIAWTLLFAVAVSPLALIGYLGRWGRFEADDFSVAVRIEQYGLLGAWVDQLRVLNGRFVGYLLVDLLALLGPRRVGLATAVAMMGVLAAAMTVTAAGTAQRSRRVVAAAVLASAVVLSSPAPDQTYLWVSGIGMVTASVVFAGLAVGLARAAAASPRWRRHWSAAAGLSAFLASGAYETTALVLIVGGAVVVAVVLSAGERPAPMVAVVLGAALGFVVVAVIPGSRTRLDDLARGHSLIVSMWEGAVASAQLIRTVPASKSVWIGFAAGLLVPAPQVSWLRRGGWTAAFGSGAFAALAAAYAISYWTLGAPPPSRTASVLMVVLVACGYAVGWVLPLRPMLVPVVVAGGVVVGAQLIEPIRDGAAARRAWAAEWDERDSTLRSMRPTDAVQVPFIQSPAGLEEVGPDPTLWVNGAVASYYDVASVTAVDNDE